MTAKPAASGFFDPDKVAKRRAFFKGIWDAVASIDPAAAMGFLQMLIGLFGGAIGLSHSSAEDKALDEDLHSVLEGKPSAKAIDAGTLAKWFEFFKVLWAFISGLIGTTPAPASLAIGDRLGGLMAIGDFLRGLDPAKLNGIVTSLTAMINTILGLLGQPAPMTVAALSSEESLAITSRFTADEVQANAIDFSKIMALVKLIMDFLAMWKKPATPANPTAFKDAAGKPLSNATGNE